MRRSVVGWPCAAEEIKLQASTATIYAHRFEAANDDVDGILGGSEAAPDKWRFSIDVARSWEQAAEEIPLPRTRKVLLRSAMTMSPDRGGIFGGEGGLRFAAARHRLDTLVESDLGAAVTQMSERVVAGGAVKEGGQRAGVAEVVQRAERGNPCLLEQIPSIVFRLDQPPQVVQQPPFEQGNQLAGRTGVPPLAPENKQFAKDKVCLGHHKPVSISTWDKD